MEKAGAGFSRTRPAKIGSLPFTFGVPSRELSTSFPARVGDTWKTTGKRYWISIARTGCCLTGSSATARYFTREKSILFKSMLRMVLSYIVRK